jgi:hypothetical protein
MNILRDERATGGLCAFGVVARTSQNPYRTKAVNVSSGCLKRAFGIAIARCA